MLDYLPNQIKSIIFTNCYGLLPVEAYARELRWGMLLGNLYACG